MAHVHYKFSSKLSYDTLVFDGPHITLADLKSRIMGREKLRAADCDLRITNAQNREEYTDSECLISKGSSVIVKRVPIVGVKVGSKNHNLERPDLRQHSSYGAVKPMSDQSFSVATPFFSKIVNLAHADVSEEDKLKTLSHQSLYDPQTYTNSFNAVPHAKYTCYRCGTGGHHIKNCPSIGTDKNLEPPVKIRKSSGIPRSFMVEVDDPNIKGAMLTSSGRYAIPTIDAEAYAIGKKERPPFLQQELPKLESKKEAVPEELLCLICRDLLSDAVVIPCCGNSYCDDCIRSALLDSEEHTCPTCGQSGVSPDTLIANKFLRQAVNNYTKEKGDSSRTDMRSAPGLSAAPSLAPALRNLPPQKPPQKLAAEPAPVQRYSPGRDAEANSAATPSLLVSTEEPAAATAEVPPERVESGSVNPQGSSTGSAQSQPPSWHQPLSSSLSYSAGGPTDASTQRHLTSSSFHATPPPLFPTPPFQPFLLPQQQSLRAYPPGYPPPSPLWNLANPQCPPVSSTASIPPLIPKDWYSKHQRESNKRSPDRGSTYRTSYSHSKSIYSKSKSHSSSRSRSRSRSQERSRYKVEHSRSSSSYSYDNKRSRSPTPSSSLSSHKSYHRKSRHDKHSCRMEESRDPYGGQAGSQDQESQQYFEWKRQYEEWCDKYFNSYVTHFQQLPPQHLSQPPPLLQGDVGTRQSGDRRRGRRTRKSSSQSRSPPTRSSESCSPLSKSSRDSRSPLSQRSSRTSSPPKDHQASTLQNKDQAKKQEHAGSSASLDGNRGVDRTPAHISAQHHHSERSSKSARRKIKGGKVTEGRRRSRSRDSRRESTRHPKATAEDLRASKDGSGSEKKKRRREESGRKDLEPCSRHRRGRAEKKKETPADEKNVWENRANVKLQKKINIKINLRAAEEKVAESAEQDVAEESQEPVEPGEETRARQTKEEDSVETSEEWQVTDVCWELGKDVVEATIVREGEEEGQDASGREEAMIVQERMDGEECADDGENPEEEKCVCDREHAEDRGTLEGAIVQDRMDVEECVGDEEKPEEGKLIHEGEEEQEHTEDRETLEGDIIQDRVNVEERTEDGEKMMGTLGGGESEETSEIERQDAATLPEETQPSEDMTTQEVEEAEAPLNSESNMTEHCRTEGTSEEKPLGESPPDTDVDVQQDVPSSEEKDDREVPQVLVEMQAFREQKTEDDKEELMLEDVTSVVSEENLCMAPSSVQEHIATSACDEKSKDEGSGREETMEKETQSNGDDALQSEEERERCSSASFLESLLPSVAVPLLSEHREIKEVEESSDVFSTSEARTTPPGQSVTDSDQQMVDRCPQDGQELTLADQELVSQNVSKTLPLTFTPYVEPQEPKVIIPGLDLDDLPVEDAPVADHSLSSHEEPHRSRQSPVQQQEEKRASGRKRESRQEQWKKYKLEKERQEAERRREFLQLMERREIQRDPGVVQEETPAFGSMGDSTNSLKREERLAAAEGAAELQMAEEQGQEVDDRWIRSM
ncbi:E3 ubiquitin-protein ligase RBBP6-like isoform X3 [Synchiropus splendidus]|uniref:E3 ubiquitin-protein ligase RBBP6-like isoform X3 n=1 Tax=Synchiropus splendidus TaxID=270530 RepID=UPI00237DC18A|nr:E3 ubiquitin-protein ligase RBBP6-like isoform X3 [Synchiropus splendidus]